MNYIKTETQYEKACERIEQLLVVVNSSTPRDSVESVELELISNLVADYETAHYPVVAPTLSELLRLRMAEMNLTQRTLAQRLGISPSRLSQYITGKSEPTLPIARIIHKELDIDSDIIIGVA